MLSIEECEKYLENRNIKKERIETIRDYLYALCKEVVDREIGGYENAVRKADSSKSH